MKNCPSCNRTYEDTLTFCLSDGTLLSAPSDPRRPEPPPAPNYAAPAPTEIMRPPFQPVPTIPSLSQPTFRGQLDQQQPVVKGSGQSKLVLGLVLLILILGSAIAMASWSLWSRNNDLPPSQSSPNRADANPTPTTETSRTSTSAPGPLTGTAPPIKPTPATVPRVNVMGTWSGMLAGREAILFINSQEGETFSGILKNTKGAIVAVSGRVDPATRQISIRETRVVEPVKQGPDWVLGSESGTLSEDGGRMSGRGLDVAGHSYTWSFAK